jgi:hypothetical protein
MYLKTAQFLQSNHPPLKLQIIVHLTSCHLDSLHCLLRVCATSDPVLHSTSLVSQQPQNHIPGKTTTIFIVSSLTLACSLSILVHNGLYTY